MAIVTFNTTPDKGTAGEIQLDKTNLAALASVTGDAYFSVDTNWKRVNLYYKSDGGNQKPYVSFDATQATPTADFFVSATARDVFEIQHIIIQDFDGGFFRIESAELVTSEFKVDVSPAPAYTIYVPNASGVDYSTDGGVTWTLTPNLSANGRTYSIAPNGDHYAGDGSNTLKRSTDSGATWSLSQSATTFQLVSNSAGDIFNANGFDIYKSIDNGSTWNVKTTSDGKAVCVSPVNDSYMLSSSSAGVLVSTDTGETWSLKTTSDGLPSNSINDVTIDSAGKMFCSTGSGVGYSTDNGATWSSATLTGNIGTLLYGIASDSITANKIYLMDYQGDFMISNDGGANISSSIATIVAGPGTTTLDVNGSTIVAEGNNGVAVSTDGGSSFTLRTISDGLSTNSGGSGKPYIHTN